MADVNKVSEIFRKAKIAEHGFSDTGIAASVLLVAFHHLAGDVEIFFFLGELFDDVE